MHLKILTFNNLGLSRLHVFVNQSRMRVYGVTLDRKASRFLHVLAEGISLSPTPSLNRQAVTGLARCCGW